jgi:hypothetical protein
MSRRKRTGEIVETLGGPEIDQVKHAAEVIGWSGPALRRLRGEAGVDEQSMAAALGITTRGVRVIEGRRRVGVAAVNRFREALHRAVIDTRSLEGTASSRSLPSSAKLATVIDRENEGQ